MPSTTNGPERWGRERVTLPDLPGWVRIGLSLLALGVAAALGTLTEVLPWALGLVILEVVAAQTTTDRRRLQVLGVQTGMVLLAVVVGYPGHAALLPLLLVPAFRAGEQHGLRAGLVTSGVLAAVTVGSAAAATGWHLAAAGPWLPAVQWSALAVAIALLGGWAYGATARSDAQHRTDAAAEEAGLLLGRLRDLARRLPAGFDVPAVAEMLLDTALAAAPAERAAVLVQIGPDEVSPVVVRGADRVPWRDPVKEQGTAHEAWVSRRTVHDVREADAAGRRTGSAVLVVPVADRTDELLGVLVLERLAARPFSAEEVRAVEAAVRTSAPRLHAAMAFVELRTLSEVAERERLAREMHDGVAQDLVALGFALDLVQRRLRQRDPGLAGELLAVRRQLNQTIQDIRYSIAALRTSVRPERGLGAALSAAVQSLGPATGAAVTSELRESPFRLPAHVESALMRLAQDFLTAVRGDPDVTRVHVALRTDPPAAELQLRHDGRARWEPAPEFAAALAGLGGRITTTGAAQGWVTALRIGPVDLAAEGGGLQPGVAGETTRAARPGPERTDALR